LEVGSKQQRGDLGPLKVHKLTRIAATNAAALRVLARLVLLLGGMCARLLRAIAACRPKAERAEPKQWLVQQRLRPRASAAGVELAAEMSAMVIVDLIYAAECVGHGRRQGGEAVEA
jgi:hypothetical protein